MEIKEDNQGLYNYVYVRESTVREEWDVQGEAICSNLIALLIHNDPASEALHSWN